MNAPETPAPFEVKVDPRTGGLGVFAAREIRVGERLGYFSGEPVPTPSRMSLQFGMGLFIEPGEGEPFRNLNHACSPSAYFEGRHLHACRDLHAGDPVTIDYSLHEAELSHPFPCKCGDSTCLETIKGWKFLTESQKAPRLALAGKWLFSRC